MTIASLSVTASARFSLSLSLSFSVPFHFKLKRIVVLHGNLVDARGKCEEDFLLWVDRIGHHNT